MPGPDRDDQALRGLLVCQGVLAAGVTLSFPFFALYLHEQRHLAMGWVGLALSATIAVSALAQALGGELADIWGAKRVMLLSLWTRAALLGGMAAAMWARRPLLAILAFHVACCFAGNLFDPAIRAWVADSFDGRARLSAYAKLRIAINAGWALGPAVGGLLATDSYPLLFALSAAVSALCWGGLRWGLAERPASRSNERFRWAAAVSVLRDRRFAEFSLWCVAIAIVTSQMVVGLSIHAVGFAGLTERQVGLLWGLNGALVILLQASVTALLAELGLSRMLVLGCLLYAAGYLWVGLAYGWRALAAAVTVVTLGELVLMPGLPAAAASLAPESLKGRYLGFLGLAHSVGAALAPLLGGLGLQWLSPRWTAGPWVCVGAIGGAAAWGFWRFGRRFGPLLEAA